jgi:hypothetical protein
MLEHTGYYKHHIYNIKMCFFFVTVHLNYSYDSHKTGKLSYKISLMNLFVYILWTEMS